MPVSDIWPLVLRLIHPKRICKLCTGSRVRSVTGHCHCHGQLAESREQRVGSGKYRPRMFWTFDQTRPGPGRPGAAIELAQAFEGTRRGTVHGARWQITHVCVCMPCIRVHDLGKNGRKSRSGRRSQVSGPGIAGYHDARIPVIPVHSPRFTVPRASIPRARAARGRAALVMLGARAMVVVERHPGSPDERWRLEGAADIFYEYVYIWNQEIGRAHV